jgi:nitric oxide reductase large subunit
VPTETLTKHGPPAAALVRSVPDKAPAESVRKHAKRVRRLKINAVAWVVGTIVLTALWVLNQWHANGAFEHFGNSGNPGDWNPTLWALGIGVWSLVVGIMALQVRFERPTADAGAERRGRLKFHVAAWAFGMLVVTPLWALIEWQDNGGLERWSGDSQPGSWEPWIFYVAGFWALGVGLIALWMYLRERRSG